MQIESLKKSWYTIFNPTSGGGMNKKNISHILSYLDHYNIPYSFIETQYPHHEEMLVEKAINQGYSKFICIGGDGTIHHMINGIMKQQYIDSNQIQVAVIPTGTGNDWIKNYQIPTDPEKAIQLIKKNKSIYQDIGKIHLQKDDKIAYFNNAAGVGFDAFVVKNLSSYKKWGALAYIIAALSCFKSFQENKLTYSLDSVETRSNIFLFSIGICKYAGAGMQLTDFKNHKNGFFDLTIIQSISLFSVIKQILKLYTGKISSVKQASCSHIQKLQLQKSTPFYIQADGELIGKGEASIELIPNAIQFII